MNNINTSHSFRRLLEISDRKYEKYVLSDSRYLGMISFIKKHLDGNQCDIALDVGCGAGVISRGLAGQFAHVTGIDGNSDNVLLAESLTEDSGHGNVTYKHGLATKLPIATGSIDLAVLNGVLEWVGANDRGENPQALQMQALREAARVLQPNGLLYLAIENRWHPRTLLRDPHTHLPAVNALPRSLANIVSNRMTGSPFQAYIYGYVKLKKMLLSVGFNRVDIFIPFPGYHYPVFYIPLYPRKASLSAIDAINTEAVKATLSDAGRSTDVNKAVMRIRRRAKYGLLGLMAHDFSFIAKKTDVS